jgi:hypothetical protein
MLIPKFRAVTADLSDEYPDGFKLYDSDLKKWDAWMDKFKAGTHIFITVEKITKRKLRSVD